MESCNVFYNNREGARLAAQNRLLKPFDGPVYQRLLAGRSNLNVLDIGCHNGAKTVDRFTGPSVRRVIGLEYHPLLAAQAAADFNSPVFAFYPCDVEAADFPRQLQLLMSRHAVAGFDIIHLSCVLMHLKQPSVLLEQLRPFLTPGGQLLVVEANDAASSLTPDPELLFSEFLAILRQDPLSGDRNFGARLPELLTACGYQQIRQQGSSINASGAQEQRRRDIFTTYFSYLPEDIRTLLLQEPHNARYIAWADWLSQYFSQLRRQVLAEHSEITIGVSLITCTGE